MLELKNITKTYPSGGEDVHALRGIDLQFRESEFVSILGPSGCGKTTMLNIIGGLDHCTSGDLEINGKSTKDFKDRDWDSYRNHSIGFVFQSYNLIPHQTVLSNVELALTLAGMSKRERREKAIHALEMVGLKEQMRKKPNQMSGGQMQRVAIARAIVNNPDIILADEPTGALDTETSVQVMEILKKISMDKLVIMVTHNPDLAEKYSTRIVKMLDGKITDDSKPLSEEEYAEEKNKCEEKAKVKHKMPKMKFRTAFGLSLKNLFTKRARTTLTCFAGSIGIIGIALIFSVSQGTNDYIKIVQEETLSSYPITIESQTMDMSSLLSTFIDNAESIEDHEYDAVYEKAMIYSFINSLTSITEHKNDLASFKNYLEEARYNPENPLSEALNGVQYSYKVSPAMYTKNLDGKVIKSDMQDLMTEMVMRSMGMDSELMASMSSMSSMYSSMNNYSQMWQELLPGEHGEAISDIIPKQYNLLYGRWPEKYNEIILFVDANNELNDLTLYALGLVSEEEVSSLLEAAMHQDNVSYSGKSWSYEEICNLDFTTALTAECYAYNEETGVYEDLRATDEGLEKIYSNGIPLKVVGIAKPVEGSISTMVYGALGYTSKLTEYLINAAYDSEAVLTQQYNSKIDIFTGLLFPEAASQLSQPAKAGDFVKKLKTYSDAEKAKMYVDAVGGPTEEEIQAKVNEILDSITKDDIIELFTSSLDQAPSQWGDSLDPELVRTYLEAMDDEDLFDMFNQYASEEISKQYEKELKESFSDLSDEELAQLFEEYVSGCSEEELAGLHDRFVKCSSSTYEKNLKKLGCYDLNTPSSINLYAAVFADKDVIQEAINNYNEGLDEINQIKYTDYVGILMGSVTKIIKAVTYVLIAFVGVSLIVSSIMIGVITLISVQERTKEIGVLRSLGASKRNVSSMFNAETMIIGFVSGLIGVVLSWIVIIPINKFLYVKTEIAELKAVLPVNIALILVAISVVLTLIAGIIPSGSAARKDPVEALRTE